MILLYRLLRIEFNIINYPEPGVVSTSQENDAVTPLRLFTAPNAFSDPPNVLN
jgi:hypothetical protein